MSIERINKWVLIVVTLAFGYLFFEQEYGLNVLIFNMLIITISLSLKPFLLNKNSTLATAIASLISATIVVIINSNVAIVANAVILLTFIGYNLNPKLSVIISLTNGFYSIATSPFIQLANHFDVKNSHPNRHTKTSSNQLKWLKIVRVAIPVLGALVFISIYANANSAFAATLEKVNIDFISWSWVKFNLISLFLICGVVYKVQIDHLTNYDNNTGNTIYRKRKEKPPNTHPLALKYELKTGVTLLLVINLILLFFNVFDMTYLISDQLPEGFTYSDYVHQGVNTLIGSIILAIMILLYFFRSNQNFYKMNKNLKRLAILWIFQNLILVAGILFKNYAYVVEYGLTYKRIGVFIYIILASVGLITTYMKVHKKLNLMFLLRSNTNIAYIILFVMAFFNWDRIITKVNLNYTQNIDYEYLLNLSDKNLPILFGQHTENKLSHEQKKRIENRKTSFIEKYEHSDWQSWNWQDYRITNELKPISNE